MICVLYFCDKDKHLAIKSLQLMKFLDGQNQKQKLILACDSKTDVTGITDTKCIFDIAKDSFKEVQLFKHDPFYGVPSWPSSATWGWQAVARHMYSNYKEPWLWLEPDAVPLHKGWLDTIEQEHIKGGQPFSGNIVKDLGEQTTSTGHMNGVGVYPWDVPAHTVMAMLTRNAWDVVMKRDMINKCHKANHVFQHCWNVTPDFRATNTKTTPASFPTMDYVNRLVDRKCAVFHRCKDGTLQDRLMDITDVVEHTQYNPPSTPSGKTTGIFIVSYGKDLEFLRACLASIKKYCTGFSEVVVQWPLQDAQHLAGLKLDAKFVFDKMDEKNPFNHHQAIKCSAEKYMTSDYIAHVDSDCMFIKPTTPNDYFVDGKPVLLIHPFEDLKTSHEGRYRWKERVKKALGWEPVFESMCRHPAVHPRWLYEKVRSHIERTTGMPFLDYVLSCEGTFPQGFAEFPTLGEYAYTFHKKDYHWINALTEKRPEDHLVQFWSKKGVTPEIRERMDKILL